jgi:carbamoyl-phosphate synthase large subunit
MDPMGIHTGDSPLLRQQWHYWQNVLENVIWNLRIWPYFEGGCNVQFAVSPDEKEDIIGIEINPRVSCSSALASKATGYPIAKVATN